MSTDPALAKKVSQELMRRDLGDIAELRRSEAFNRYFLRRLGEKKAAIQTSLLDHTPAELAAKDEDREVLRRINKTYEEILKMMDAEERIIHSQLSQLG